MLKQESSTPVVMRNQLKEELLEIWEKQYIGRLFKSKQDAIDDVETMISESHQAFKRKQIELDTGITLKGKKLLEVGSGVGDFVAQANFSGVDAYGIEPYNGAFEDLEELVSRFSEAHNIGQKVKRAVGEAIPFEDDTFDVVYSYYAFEHVEDPQKVLSESLRVLKPGGTLYFVFPNYGSFWEGHYGTLWFPFLSKSTGKWYVEKILKRDSFMVDELQLIKKKNLDLWLEQCKFSGNVVTYGKEKFIKEVSSLTFNESGSLGIAKKFLIYLQRIGLLKLVVKFLAMTNMYTPFYLILKK